MATQVQKMTARDFLALPTSNLPHEVVHGGEITWKRGWRFTGC